MKLGEFRFGFLTDMLEIVHSFAPRDVKRNAFENICCNLNPFVVSYSRKKSKITSILP